MALRWPGRTLSARTAPGVDILPVMNDQDCKLLSGGNVSRFALHRQGQNSQVCPRWHAMACGGLTLVLPNSAGPGYRRAGLPTNPGVRLTVQTSVVRMNDPGLRCALEACTLGYCTCSFAGRAVAIGTNSSGVSPGYPAQAKGTDRVDEVADKLIVRPHVTLAGANDIEASFGDTQANAAIWQASYHDATTSNLVYSDSADNCPATFARAPTVARCRGIGARSGLAPTMRG